MQFFRTSKVMIAIALVFALSIVLFNVYDIATDKTDKVAYTTQDIEKLNIELVNINTASADTLCKVSGIGEKTAQEIVDYREKNGDFKSTDEIMNVKGIGKSDYIRILPMITI